MREANESRMSRSGARIRAARRLIRATLTDKSWEERRQVGLYALVKFKVLKP
jgi:hypothetical protein